MHVADLTLDLLLLVARDLEIVARQRRGGLLAQQRHVAVAAPLREQRHKLLLPQHPICPATPAVRSDQNAARMRLSATRQIRSEMPHVRNGQQLCRTVVDVVLGDHLLQLSVRGLRVQIDQHVPQIRNLRTTIASEEDVKRVFCTRYHRVRRLQDIRGCLFATAVYTSPSYHIRRSSWGI